MTLRASLLALLLIPTASWAKEPRLTAEEIVARHRDSIGPAEARQAAQSRIAEGATLLTVLVGGSGTLRGRALLFSDASGFRAALRFNAPDYSGESFGFVQDKVDVGMVQPGIRSEIGHFLASYDEPLRDGLLGGALSTSWPLYAPGLRGAKLKYDGLKKVEGASLHQLTYGFARRRSGIEVRLFFEPESFRHVRTTYKLRIPPPMTTSITESSQQEDTVYELEEVFEDFETENGLSLPRRWLLRFGAHGERVRTGLWRFDTRFERFRENLPTGGS
jgi:hypothetical protein